MIPPNFFILGAPRAATTFLYRALSEHPHIFMSTVKETGFFSEDGRQSPWFTPVASTGKKIRTWAEYLALFASAGSYPVRGEASTGYLADPHAAEQIQRRLDKSPRFIAILRNPVERAYSHFIYHRMINVEPAKSFEEALKDEPRRQAKNWNIQWRYRETGLYGEHLERYMKLFGPERFLVLLHEDFADPQKVFERTFQFLQVERASIHMDNKVNQSGVSRGTMASWLLQKDNPLKLLARRILPPSARRRLRNRLTDKPPALSPATQEELLAFYRQDMVKTERLIGQSLDPWRQFTPSQ